MFISWAETLTYVTKFRAYAKKQGFKRALIKSFKKLRTIWWVKHGNAQQIKAFSKEEFGTLFLYFRCNVCGSPCVAKVGELKRETPSCPICGSTVRRRAIIHVLSMELFGKSISLTDFPIRWDIIGIGMSDWIGYAAILEKKLGYTNTYYHQEPKLDITVIDSSLEGTLDFIISTDVFEHISPPVSMAFQNARRLLKQTGVLIFSVPYTRDGRTEEHFPELYKYEIMQRGDSYTLRNVTKEGGEQVFDNLTFHSGFDERFGVTLEMRIFSESSLMEEFEKAGFKKVKIYKESIFDYGICWENDVSLPIALRIE